MGGCWGEALIFEEVGALDAVGLLAFGCGTALEKRSHGTGTHPV